MSLLIFSYRKQDIIARKHSLNFKLLQLNRKLMDLQTYAASIADGVISMNDMMNAPSSMFGRLSVFAKVSHMSAMNNANQKMSMFAASGMMNQNLSQMQNFNLSQQQQMQQRNAYISAVRKSFYEAERQKCNKVEEKLLSIQEKKIEQEKARIKTQLNMLEAEEKTVSQAEDKGAKSSAPHYVA